MTETERRINKIQIDNIEKEIKAFLEKPIYERNSYINNPQNDIALRSLSNAIKLAPYLYSL